MKKKHFILSILIICLSVSQMNAQTAYDYAFKWKEKRDTTKNIDLQKFYSNPFSKELDFEKIKVLIGGIKVSGTQDAKTNILPTNFQSILIDGTAKYAAEAFREQATTLYIDKFRRELEKASDFQYLLPKTYKYLQEGDLFKYENLGNSIKQTFDDDLDNIVLGIGEFVDKSKVTETACEKNMEICNVVKFSLDIGNQIKEKTQFVDIVKYLDAKYKNDSTNYYKYYKVIHSINLIQQNIRKENKPDEQGTIVLKKPYQNLWLSKDDINKLDNPLDWVYFLAFIYHQDTTFFDNSIVLSKKSIKLSDIKIANGKIISDDLRSLRDYALNTISILHSIEKIQSQEEVKAQEYIEIFSDLSTMMKMVNDKNQFVNNKYLEIIQSTIDIARSIVKKDYAHVVKGGAAILRNVLQDTTKKDSSNKYVNNFIKYGTFMVDVTTTKNSDDMKEVIKHNVTNYTYLDKRKTDFSITLNADPGIIPFTSIESIDSFKSVKNSFAITCPIGFDFIFGSKEKESYTGISLNIFDIGAAFAYRLGDSESELPETLTLKQVFSPGIAIKHGIKNTPICWALGYQYTPALRTVTVDKISEAKNAGRIFLRFTWDLPLAKIIGGK